ncbi:MAG TPA: hypothetical protein DEO84_01580 [candidate division Zixibacteria bacterium]|nr:hypothetical protein [candidate division Zixibacteria bacterium]HBY99987.1 hypothetical protein [candidate division Zixibacteria bacterium]
MNIRAIITVSILVVSVWFVDSALGEAIIANHQASADFTAIPEAYFNQIRANYNFFYGHTSHGSQIMTGISILEVENGVLYAQPDFSEYGSDLGHNGDISWVTPTRDYLDSHPSCNVVMWSWCGGVSDNNEEGINSYLNAMNQLELDYPGVTFVYMTGHLDGSGMDGTLYANNNQIRAYCESNDKVLFDFADIESYDPDGTYYPDETDYCNWCYDWCAIHTCPSCNECAHSHCFNCYLKGKAFWWMMARVDGWQGGTDTIPNILAISPEQNELNVATNANISVTFDINMDPTTINNSTFIVNGRSTGLHNGSISYNPGTRTATFNPDEDFTIGEIISVTLSNEIQSSGGINLTDSYSWNFVTIVLRGNAVFDYSADYPTSDFPVGDGPISVYAGLLNNDDVIDLAVANGLMSTVSVLYGNGDGTFQNYVEFPLFGSNGAVAVAGADFNGDSYLDLTVASHNSNNITVLFNNGSGIFGSQLSYAAGQGPRSVCPADLDGDGDIDLAVSNENSDNVSVLLNSGDGTFTGPSTYAAGDDARSVCAADFDNDGDIDLAVANSLSGNVSILMNSGNGSFAGQILYDVGSIPRSILSCDLNADGYSDLAIANAYDDNISLLINNGSGSFATNSTYSIGYYAWPISIFAADFDNDSDLDLITANDQSDNVSVFLNDGAGAYSIDSSYAVGEYPYSVFSADFDADGAMDLATANYEGQNVSILLNFIDSPICQYLPGDANNSNTFTGLDVTYSVRYFKGGPHPPYSCECTSGNIWYVSGDVNGSCSFSGLDVTYMVRYFKGGAVPIPCADCPPSGILRVPDRIRLIDANK